MLGVQVVGGTRAGWRILHPKPKRWTCDCGHLRPSYLTACSRCGKERP